MSYFSLIELCTRLNDCIYGISRYISYRIFRNIIVRNFFHQRFMSNLSFVISNYSTFSYFNLSAYCISRNSRICVFCIRGSIRRRCCIVTSLFPRISIKNFNLRLRYFLPRSRIYNFYHRLRNFFPRQSINSFYSRLRNFIPGICIKYFNHFGSIIFPSICIDICGNSLSLVSIRNICFFFYSPVSLINFCFVIKRFTFSISFLNFISSNRSDKS